MAYQSPVRERVERVRLFRGIAGDTEQVLVRKTNQGDSSLSIANETYDLSLTEKGTLVLRDGSKKDKSSTADINTIFQLFLGGLNHYGIYYGGGIDLISLPPKLKLDDIEEEIIPADYPAIWGSPASPTSDVPPNDPSSPPDEQACPASLVQDSSPATLAFSMPFGGPVPAKQAWYWKNEGHWENILTASISTPIWASAYATSSWAWDTGPCYGIQVAKHDVSISGKDIFGSWLTETSYTDYLKAYWSNGVTQSCTLVLDVKLPAMTLGGDTTITDTYSGTPLVKSATITCSGEDTSILRWTASVSGQLSAYPNAVVLSASSGSTVQGGAASTLGITIDGTGLSEGSYTGIISIAGEAGSGVATQTIPIALAVSLTPPAVCPYNAGNLLATITTTHGGDFYHSGGGHALGSPTVLSYDIGNYCHWEKTCTPSDGARADCALEITNPGYTSTWSDGTSLPALLAGLTYPCWMINVILDASHGRVGIYIKSTGSSVSGTYTKLWTTPDFADREWTSVVVL